VDHDDHVGLLRDGVEGRAPGSWGGDTAGSSGAGGTWADIGAGTGAFTLALADLLGPGGRIVAIDRDRAALAENARAIRARFPGVAIATLVADMTGPLDLPLLDGIVAANSLHFVLPADQAAVVARLAAHLRPGAPFVIVEYDVDRGNRWVPHPFTFETWRLIAAEAGLVAPERLGHVPSGWIGGIHSALARRATESGEREV